MQMLAQNTTPTLKRIMLQNKIRLYKGTQYVEKMRKKRQPTPRLNHKSIQCQEIQHIFEQCQIEEIK